MLNSKSIIIIAIILIISSLVYLSTEEKYEVKEVTKEIKLNSNTK